MFCWVFVLTASALNALAVRLSAGDPDDSPIGLSPEPPRFMTITDPQSLESLPRNMWEHVWRGKTGEGSASPEDPIVQIVSDKDVPRPVLTRLDVMNPELVLSYATQREDALIPSVIGGEPDFKPFLENAFRGHICDLVKSPNGHHVVEAMISNWRADDVQFVVEELGQFDFDNDRGIGAASKHQYGTKIVQRLISHGALKPSYVSELMDIIQILSLDVWGHYVVEVLIEHQGLDLGLELVEKLEELLYLPSTEWTRSSTHCKWTHLCVIEKEWDNPSISTLHARWGERILKRVTRWINDDARELAEMLADDVDCKLIANCLEFAGLASTRKTLQQMQVKVLRKLSEAFKARLESCRLH